MTTASSMIQYYAARAREYDRIYDKPERQSELQILRTFIEETFRNERVCEVACGTGYWTQYVAKTATSIWATDRTEATLEMARTRKLGAHVKFDCQDAFNLPLPPQPFTAGLAGFLWSHISKPDIQKFLSSFHSALKPGSIVVCMDNVFAEGSSTPISRTDSIGNTYQTRRLENGSKHEIMKNFPTESELLKAVEGISTDATVQCYKYYWTLTYRTSLSH
jgi:ubiquinone/menaquinone biosynthesis C-methylase UbiE